ncbi:MAG: 4Fe-4S binding protein [Bacteroidales bacterium]|jgi:pyruvate ferredoxin oxidoreductase delta subunit|nr:4Fe-4S binding protein [Bacteroidales bacterium]
MSNRPTVQHFNSPKHISDYPVGPAFRAGFLTSTNAGWRSERPVLVAERCTLCYQCYMYCPEATVFKITGAVDFDFDYCKGCGICAEVCAAKAITMIPEKR